MRSRPSRRAASRPPMSWASATSPMSSDDRAAGRGGDAERGGDRAVDAVGAAVGEHARRAVGARRGRESRRRGSGIEEATNSVASGRQRLGPSRAASGSDRASVAERRRSRAAARRRRPSVHAVSHAASRGRGRRRPASASSAATRVAADRASLTHRGGILPGALGVERELLDAVERRPARRAAAWRWAGRRRGARARARRASAKPGSRSSRS